MGDRHNRETARSFVQRSRILLESTNMANTVNRVRNMLRIGQIGKTTPVPNLRRLTVSCFLFSLLVCSQPVLGQVFNERFEDWPVALKINGRVIVANELPQADQLAGLLNERGRTGTLCLLAPAHYIDKLTSGLESAVAKVVPLDGLRDAAAYESAEVLLWFTTPNFKPEFQYLDRQAEVLRKQVEMGKTVVVIGGAAKWCASLFLTNTDGHPTLHEGTGLLPDSVLQLDYKPESDRPRILSALASHPSRVGIGLNAKTALLLSGRKLLVAGEGSATLLLASDGRQPFKSKTISGRTGERSQRVTDFLADLTQWRREAKDRTLETFPSIAPELPSVPNGKLFIVGGGGMPDNLMTQFVEAAGGKKAKLVYVPCSEQEEVSPRQSMVNLWKRMGVDSVSLLHTKDRIQANSDEAFYAPLKDATGIWFGGGRQWNFSDSYFGTTTHRLMKEVLQRGGVIGGSSAGASIQARYLCRATPIENFLPMAPGYERGGLGFISGIAIDQHFSQRRRQKDMTSLVNRYPQLLGIGIDEATAIIVEGSTAQVTGRGKVHFYDRKQPVYPDRPDYIALSAGQSYDLIARTVLAPKSSGSEEETPEE